MDLWLRLEWWYHDHDTVNQLVIIWCITFCVQCITCHLHTPLLYCVFVCEFGWVDTSLSPTWVISSLYSAGSAIRYFAPNLLFLHHFYPHALYSDSIWHQQSSLMHQDLAIRGTKVAASADIWYTVVGSLTAITGVVSLVYHKGRRKKNGEWQFIDEYIENNNEVIRYKWTWKSIINVRRSAPI